MRVPASLTLRALDSSSTTTFNTSPLYPRDGKKGPPIPAIIVAVVAASVVLIAATFFGLRRLRSRHQKPKYIPTPFLKRLWSDWKVPKYGHRYQLPSDGDDDGDAATRGANHMRDARNNLRASLRQPGTGGASTAGTEAGVDRNTSVRSVMTLPAYRMDANEHEQVLGREGERGGIDVVVEMPTAEDEEALREEEMEALYQIRLARRRQIQEREERRQRRREARARNDAVALEELRRRARENADANAAEAVQELRREHERIKETRQRAVSSVSYHDVGVVRADGTRLRANSTESERVGLLSDAASIAPSARSASGSGPGSLFHRRDRSASSVLSIDTGHSPPGSPGMTTGDSTFSLHGAGNRSRANSGPNTPRAGSSPEMIDAAEADLGEIDMPPHSPPGYDDVSLDELTPANSRESRSRAESPYNEPPPDYPGPTQMRNRRLSAQMADLAASATEDQEPQTQAENRRLSRGVGGIPQLPSLRLTRLPQIVIEPSTAVPGDDER
ncbi:hypothetical protein GE09DRAFT_5822 [Coniochaeta sp. 2T2.1]|nr:hypothetical protein GE09DRAFT_5822 [Coniochaeta sp. 2T2.1]